MGLSIYIYIYVYTSYVGTCRGIGFRGFRDVSLRVVATEGFRFWGLESWGV